MEEYSNAEWMMPLGERLAADIKYCIIEWKMTKDEAEALADGFSQLLSIAAIRKTEAK